MKFIGTLKEPIINFLTKKPMIVFEPEQDFAEVYEELKAKTKLTLEIKVYREKRSLDANAYYWVLITKLAKKVETSNSELHNAMLSNYGFPELIDGQLARIPIPDTEEAEATVRKATAYHLRQTTQVKEGRDGVSYRTYILMRGSSSYNTEEMARLIEGLISECKEAGMPDAEIMTPDEKQQLKERYGVNIG